MTHSMLKMWTPVTSPAKVLPFHIHTLPACTASSSSTDRNPAIFGSSCGLLTETIFVTNVDGRLKHQAFCGSSAPSSSEGANASSVPASSSGAKCAAKCRRKLESFCNLSTRGTHRGNPTKSYTATQASSPSQTKKPRQAPPSSTLIRYL